MKNFSFDNLFADLFDENMFGNKFIQFMGNPGSSFEGRHNLKLMYLRKDALNLPYWKSRAESQDENKEYSFPEFIYGPGRGLESRNNLQFWNQEPEDDWTTDDEENIEENEGEFDEEEENVLEIFIQDNSVKKSKNSFICRYCESKDPEAKFTKKGLTKHFIETHKIEFEEYFGPDYSWEEAVSEAQANQGKKGKKKPKMQFMSFEDMMGGGMPGGFPGGMPGGFPGGMPGGFPGGMPGGMPGFGFMPFDMGQMGQMFGMNASDTEQMMKDMEKMFSGMGMGGGFPEPGHNKKKK
jgi:hypothetical protein